MLQQYLEQYCNNNNCKRGYHFNHLTASGQPSIKINTGTNFTQDTTNVKLLLLSTTTTTSFIPLNTVGFKANIAYGAVQSKWKHESNFF